MTAEQFGVRNASGTAYVFPKTARPSAEWGEKYDITANRAAHIERYWLEGTGQTVPETIGLVMELDTADEQATESLIAQIVSAARQATAITRTAQPDRAVLGLQSWGTAVLDEGDSSVRRLTLTWWPAAPGQTTGYTPAPAPVTPTLTVYLGGVSSTVVTVSQAGNAVWVGTVISGQGITGLVTGQTYTITGAAVSGYTTPAPQTIDMQAGQTALLTYVAEGQTTPPPSNPDTGVY